MPDAGSFAKLEALVSTLAGRLGTAAFAPHVTLIHGLALEESELAARAATLSKRLRVPPVELGPLEARDEFFRSLYLRAEPSDWFRVEHAGAAEAYGVSPDPAYLPHLSLVYGRVDASEKERVSTIAADRPSAIELTAIEVWRTHGPVGDWRLRRRLPLGGS